MSPPRLTDTQAVNAIAMLLTDTPERRPVAWDDLAKILQDAGRTMCESSSEDVPPPPSRRLALTAEYVRLIGYDPFMDEPSISEETVAQTLRDWKLEALTAEYTAWREANGFAKECALELLNSGRANDTQSAWLTLFNARWDEAAQ